MTRTLRFTMIALVVAAIAPATAVADKRIAVSSFRGNERAAAKLERDVRKILGKDFRVAKRSADSVDAVVYGTVTRRRSNYYVFHLLVVEKATGKRFEELVFTLDRPRLRGDVRRQVVRGLRDHIGDIAGGSEDLDEDELSEESLEEEIDDEDALEDDALDVDGDELDDSEALEELERVDGGAPRGRLASIPMELIAGTNIIERTLFASSGDTALADFFARGDVYPLTQQKSAIRHLGAVVELSRPFASEPAMDVEAAPGPPTELIVGATTRQRFARGPFVVLAKADVGVNLTMADGGQNDVNPLLRATVATGAEFKTFLFLAEAANFETNGAASDFNALPNLIVDWRLRHGGIHPFAIAVVPLQGAVREQVPLILQIGVRYEQ